MELKQFPVFSGIQHWFTYSADDQINAQRAEIWAVKRLKLQDFSNFNGNKLLIVLLESSVTWS